MHKYILNQMMNIQSTVVRDVILFAVLLALTASGKYKKAQLGVLITLLGHLFLTTGSKHQNGKSERSENMEALGESSLIDTEKTGVETENDIKRETGPQSQPTNTIASEEVKTVTKAVSNSEFDRQFSIPQEYSKIDAILPTTSESANSKLARYRTSFFDNIL